MKTFTATIILTGLKAAIESLPGWSHKGDTSKRAVSFYPFTVSQVRIYFKAKHRTEAAKQLGLRMAETLPRDLVEYRAEAPEVIVARKRELARRITAGAVMANE